MNRQALLVTVLPPLAFAYILWALRHLPWTPLRIMGLVLTVLGLVFLTLARVQLGNSFSWNPQAKNLVTTGLYSRIRNPVYVFGGVTLFGLILYVQRPWWFVAFAAVAVMQLLRARAEARVLEEKFGDDYRRWRAQTWF
jgi:protein-S-isoprenylcysteine O-methyltransferase Ste14